MFNYFYAIEIRQSPALKKLLGTFPSCGNYIKLRYCLSKRFGQKHSIGKSLTKTDCTILSFIFFYELPP